MLGFRSLTVPLAIIAAMAIAAPFEQADVVVPQEDVVVPQTEEIQGSSCEVKACGCICKADVSRDTCARAKTQLADRKTREEMCHALEENEKVVQDVKDFDCSKLSISGIKGLSCTQDPHELDQVDDEASDDEASDDEENDEENDEASDDEDEAPVTGLFADNVDFDQRARTAQGKLDAQYMWMAKVMGKASLHSGSCKPATTGKKPARAMSCGRRLLNDEAFLAAAQKSDTPASRKLLGSCGCRGWTQIGPVCVQPCHEHGANSHDSGAYCHRPCDQHGQIALRVGCGLGHDRVCVETSGDCFNRHFSRAISVAEIMMFVGTAGASSAAMKSAAQASKLATANKGRRALAAFARSMKKSVVKMKNNAMKNSYIKSQVSQFSAGVRDRILENGATLLLASNVPTDWGAVATEIAATVDPSGVVGFGASFIPPKSCQDQVYVKGGIPTTFGSGPDYDALEIVEGRWDWTETRMWACAHAAPYTQFSTQHLDPRHGDACFKPGGPFKGGGDWRCPTGCTKVSHAPWCGMAGNVHAPCRVKVHKDRKSVV